MANTINMDIDTYTLTELMAIVGINELDQNKIIANTNAYIQKYKNTNPDISVFFSQIQDELLSAAKENEWYENEYLQQSDEIQSDKITDRKQKVQVYENDHQPMNREQLGVSNTYNLPVAQDVLNPNLKNVITRLVNLDSQYRQFSNGPESGSTDYTLDLSDTLKNVLSIKLFSYQIPYSWYTVDVFYGNTCFWITYEKYNVAISIQSGNYNTKQFVDALNASFATAGFTFSSTAVSIDEINGKITLNLYQGVFSGEINDETVTFTIDGNTVITFFDFTGNLQCGASCLKGTYLNQSLGWIMGFRVPYVHVNVSGNTASSIIDLNGTKYLILVLDDYNQNHVNTGLVSITEYTDNLKNPYYSQDLPYYCIAPNVVACSEQNEMNSQLIVSDKLNVNYSGVQQILPSAPRTLTQSQIYSYNEINKNHANNNYKSRAPTTPDILAIIPIKTSGVSTGTLLVEFSGSLQENIRTYFGPVNIDRMRLKLLDDKGNILNMNGSDWCITLICECLYQY